MFSFAILGGPAVTCTRSTTTGDVGVASTTAFTNTGCTITGTIHAGDAFAAQAYNDYLGAYNNVAATPCSGAILTGTLAGRNLAPGVYCDVFHGDFTGGSCTGPTYTVNSDGWFQANIAAQDGLALHAGAKVG